MNTYHVWGSQVVLDAGTYHMVASIYPADLDFDQSWLYAAQIAHATSFDPLGPYTFQSIILPYGSESAWDRSVMNPKLLRAPLANTSGAANLWLLFYTGDSYTGPTPNATHPPPKNQSAAQASQMVGLATASAPAGPYKRFGAPVLQPRPGAWDARITTNPAVVAYGNGSEALLMVYKGSSPAGAGTAQTQVCLGVAASPRWDAPFERLRDDPILPCPPNTFYSEDPTLWKDAVTGYFHLVFKDFAGHWTGDGYSGAHAISLDGVSWNLTQPALAYTRTHVWSDGVSRTQGRQERAQVRGGCLRPCLPCCRCSPLLPPLTPPSPDACCRCSSTMGRVATGCPSQCSTPRTRASMGPPSSGTWRCLSGRRRGVGSRDSSWVREESTVQVARQVQVRPRCFTGRLVSTFEDLDERFCRGRVTIGCCVCQPGAV